MGMDERKEKGNSTDQKQFKTNPTNRTFPAARHKHHNCGF